MENCIISTMRFSDEGIVLDVKKILENRFSIKVFTKDHGRIKGITHKKVDISQHILLDYSSKNSNESGFIKINRTTILLFSLSLSPFVSSSCHLLAHFLPEHHPYLELYLDFFDLLSIRLENSKGFYIWFEERLLQYLGFGLSLTHCAVTDTQDNLLYISPKTGRAVSEVIGQPYQTHLLTLPKFMSEENYTNINTFDFSLALRITGYFIRKHLGELPAARQLLR